MREREHRKGNYETRMGYCIEYLKEKWEDVPVTVVVVVAEAGEAE